MAAASAALQERERTNNLWRLHFRQRGLLLHEAVAFGGLAEVEAQLAQCGGSPRELLNLLKSTDMRGHQPLHALAIFNTSPEAVAIALRLLEAGAPPAAPSARGSTPLFLACANRSCPLAAELAQLLLLKSPQAASIANARGRLPLHAAASNTTHPGAVQMVNMLIKAFPAAVDTNDLGGCTPLHAAVKMFKGAFSSAVVQALLAANPSAALSRDHRSHTPLLLTAKFAHGPQAALIVRALVKASPGTQAPELYRDKIAPLLAAAAHQRGTHAAQVVAALLEVPPASDASEPVAQNRTAVNQRDPAIYSISSSDYSASSAGSWVRDSSLSGGKISTSGGSSTSSRFRRPMTIMSISDDGQAHMVGEPAKVAATSEPPPAAEEGRQRPWWLPSFVSRSATSSTGATSAAAAKASAHPATTPLAQPASAAAAAAAAAASATGTPLTPADAEAAAAAAVFPTSSYRHSSHTAPLASSTSAQDLEDDDLAEELMDVELQEDGDVLHDLAPRHQRAHRSRRSSNADGGAPARRRGNSDEEEEDEEEDDDQERPGPLRAVGAGRIAGWALSPASTSNGRMRKAGAAAGQAPSPSASSWPLGEQSVVQQLRSLRIGGGAQSGSSTPALQYHHATFMLDAKQRNALHHAACSQKGPSAVPVVRVLLEAAPEMAQATDAAGLLPLHVLARRNRHWEAPAIASELIKSWPPALIQGDRRGRLPIHVAAKYQWGLFAPRLIRTLVMANADALQVRDEGGEVALHRAAAHQRGPGAAATVAVLLEYGPAALRVANGNGRRALEVAQAPQVIQALVDADPAGAEVLQQQRYHRLLQRTLMAAQAGRPAPAAVLQGAAAAMDVDVAPEAGPEAMVVDDEGPGRGDEVAPRGGPRAVAARAAVVPAPRLALIRGVAAEPRAVAAAIEAAVAAAPELAVAGDGEPLPMAYEQRALMTVRLRQLNGGKPLRLCHCFE